MNGQWIGPYTGTNDGFLVIDLDDAGDHYAGVATAIDSIARLPPTFAELANVPKGKKHFQLRVPLLPIDRRTALPTTWETLKAHYPPDILVPVEAELDWEIGDDAIKVSWKTPIQTSGSGTVHKSRSSTPSELVPLADVKTWEEFRRFARELEPYRFIFRGQRCNQWRLRTSFHRTGRASLFKFLTQDIPTLHRLLSGLMVHPLDPRDGQQNAAFYNLIQHHGYPTPLLDWTYSPFIGAYFAYKKDARKSEMSQEDRVRIFMFDKLQWSQDLESIAFLTSPKLHFTIIEPLALNNPRVVPQQSVSSLTNILHNR